MLWWHTVHAMNTQVVEGKALRDTLVHDLKATLKGVPCTLELLVVGDDPVVATFVRQKRRLAEQLGVSARVRTFDASATTEALVAAVRNSTAHGVVVQLPLPAHIDTHAVLEALPREKDIDVLSDAAYAEFAAGTPTAYTPPVAAAVDVLLNTYNVTVAGARAVVVGQGKLVGQPVHVLLEHRGAQVSVVTVDTPEQESAQLLRGADIIVSGTGVPGRIQPEMVREGAVLIDAGTSDVGGTLCGDIDPKCAQRASVFSPVPGGVGPLTVAMLFANLARACVECRV